MYTNAFFAAELAGKALLLEHAGLDVRRHEICGPLSDRGLVPVSLYPKQLSAFFESTEVATDSYLFQ